MVACSAKALAENAAVGPEQDTKPLSVRPLKYCFLGEFTLYVYERDRTELATACQHHSDSGCCPDHTFFVHLKPLSHGLGWFQVRIPSVDIYESDVESTTISCNRILGCISV